MALTKAEIVDASWRKGVLKYKLKPHQYPIYDAIWKAINNKEPSVDISCSRQFGKTFTDILIAIEFGLRNPNSRIPYAIPVGKEYVDMVLPSVQIILEDMPEPKKDANGKPIEEPLVVHSVTGKRLLFSNGSIIKFAGVNDDKGVGLRGNRAHLIFCDEAAFMDNLKDLVYSVLKPQLTTTGGCVVYITTPPDTPDHDYVEIHREHVESGRVVQFTIWDNTSMSMEQKLKIKDDYKNEPDRFAREYECQFVINTVLALCREWSDSADEDGNIPFEREWERDEYFDHYLKYIVLDTGVRDLTAGLFGYVDFKNHKLVIEDELTMNGPDMTTNLLAAAIKKQQDELWPGQKITNRIADSNNLHLIQDLTIDFNLPFVPVMKTDLEQMVNEVRILVQRGDLIVHPRCTKLNGCLRYGVWTKTRDGKKGDKFGRSDTYGHYDHFAALMYLVRSVDWYTNPIPKMYGLNVHQSFTPQQIQTATKDVATLNKILLPRRSR